MTSTPSRPDAGLPQPSNPLQSHLLSHLSSTSSSPARLEALYSDFSSSKSLNPPGYASNVSFWAEFVRGMLGEGLQKGSGKSEEKGNVKERDDKASTTTGVPDYLVLHATDSLLASLRLPRLGSPYGLPVALTSLTSSPPHPPTLIRKDLFLASPKSIYDKQGWAAWVWGGVRGTVGWGAGKVGLGGRELEGEEAAEKRWKDVKGDWVHIPLLEQAADSLWDLVSARPSLSSADRLATRSSLRADILDYAGLLDTGETPCSDLDLEVMIRYLERDKQRAVVQGEIIKFAPKGGFQLWEDTQISETDKGIVEIRETARQLDLQISVLEDQISTRTAKAKSYLSQSPPNKALASTHLKIRASLSSLLVHRTTTLLSLKQILDSISRSCSDAELARVYEISAGTLRVLAEKVGGVEGVEATREKLEDALAGGQEVEEAMSGISAPGGEDREAMEAEVQKELDQMVKEEEAKEKEEEKDKVKVGGEGRETPTKELEERLKALKPPSEAQAEKPASSASAAKTDEGQKEPQAAA